MSADLKKQKRAIIDAHARPDNARGLMQLINTLLPLAALWACIVPSAKVSYWLTAAVVTLMVFFLVRVFVLMHECGHGSMFKGARWNQAFAFVLGVVSAMPAYVWLQHHLHHHATNGNWAKYRGPLSIITVSEYTAMGSWQQRHYRYARHLALAPVGGLLYLIINPRWTWIKGSGALLVHLLRRTVAQRGVTLQAHAQAFKTPYWSTAREYWHMTANNIALLCVWALMSWLIGPVLFFVCYLISMSIAGGIGIVLFTVQHNFEHAYASHDEGWDYDTAVISGTSFLQLPGWLNWFTANIGYHHIHHLSATIPNYRLAVCHREFEHLFSDVSRITFTQIPSALKYILWDTVARRIVSPEEISSKQH